MKVDLKTLKKRAKKELDKATEPVQIEEINKKYLGDKGEISLVFASLKSMTKVRRSKIGQEANKIKNWLKAELEEKKAELKKSLDKNRKKEFFDITVPGRKISVGHLHPLGQVERKIEDIFQSMGFSIIEGPEVESEWYNFDALNIPKEHPARDRWDTFWLKDLKLILRTHTSPVQIRYMEKNRPPLRILAPGRVFRNEATDAGHEINFYQVEGLMIGKKGEVSAANFKAVIEEFFAGFFAKKVKVRLRPSFFPFTEPSFEVDVQCLVCGGKNCPTCKHSGWVEVVGAGMVHPNVLKNAGLNPKNYQGFAFGMGMDRLTMMKYRISDIRLFYSGDLRFLEQF